MASSNESEEAHLQSSISDSDVTHIVESIDSAEQLGATSVTQPAHESLRRSDRDRKLALKAREQKIVELSQNLFKRIDEHLDQNEKFLTNADSLALSDVQDFVNGLDDNVNAIHSVYNEIKTLGDNKVEKTVQTFFDQFLEDNEHIKDYLKQREEDQYGEERLLEEDLKLQKAKKQLEEEMKQLEARMSARRARMLQRKTSIDVEATQSPAQPSLQATQVHSQQQPLQQQLSADHLQVNSQPISPFQTPVQRPGQETTFQAAAIADAITDHMHISLVSPPEPSVFTGDPLQYADWRVSFDSLIHSKRGTPMEKLHRLKKYVNGDALAAISDYFRLQTSNAYEEALNTLREEFGRDDFVGNSFIDKLESWPKIANKDQAALKQYSYFLKQCLIAQKTLPKLKFLDEKRENKKFIKALPPWMVNRWTYIVTDHEEKNGFPPFSRYVEFVSHEARVANNNMREASETKHNSKSSTDNTAKPQSVKSYQSTTSTGENCMFCHKGRHLVTECRSLAAKSEDEKKQFIMEHRLCFSCLKVGHSSKACPEKAKCAKCKRPHPTVLHREGKATKADENKDKQSKAPTTAENSKEVKQVSANATKQGKGQILSMLVPVYVSTGSSEQLVYAMLDTQSDVSFISQSLAAKLRPNYTSERVTITTLNGQKTKLMNRHKVNVRGFGLAITEEVELDAYEQESIPCTPSQIPNRGHIAGLPHLNSLLRKLPPKMDIPVGLLIGVDCSQALAPLETILGQEGEPFAVKTKLGWTLCGETNKAAEQVTVLHTQVKGEDAFDDNHYNQLKLSQNDLQFLDTLQAGMTRLDDGSYCLPLPLRDKGYMPNNKVQAEKRLNQLVQKFKKDEAYKQEYFSFLQDMINSGHAELAPENAVDGKEWYIPHFGIYHPKKKKLRVVFDASARYANQSLNDKLLTGPEHINSLVGILLRFRKNPIAISCDVEKMFHNFYVPDKHRDYLRFLWIDQNMAIVKAYRMTRHLFGATSSPGVATFALRHIAKQLADEKPTASEFIVKDFYVDDGITSVNTVDEAVNLITEATSICSSANLRLHKFVSNSREVLATMPSSEIAKEMQGIDLFCDSLPTERTLGLEWSVQTDTIEFKNNMKLTAPTRRGILSVVSQLYDPLGLLSPFTLKGKRVSQKACQEKGEWDAEVSSALQQEWNDWVNELDNLENIKIERCIKPKDFGKIIRAELHHFSDASLQGYGACSYLRAVNEEDTVHVVLLMAKGRVAPAKQITVPRLELQAAVEAVRLSATLKAELDIAINQEFFWSDSAIVIGYIRNSEQRYHMFVANRVQEIRSSSECNQ